MTFQPTLPQGERRFMQIMEFSPANFNPRFRKGSDILPPDFHKNIPGFQPTLPQGERPWPVIKRGKSCGYFNPRSRKGSDSFDLGGDFEYPSFNPRSRKGSDV